MSQCLLISSFLIQYRFKRYFWNLICPLKYYKTNLKLLSLQIKLRSSKSMSSIFFRQSVSFSISAAKQNPFLYFLQYNSQQQQNLSFILNIIFLTLIIYFHKILQYFKIFIWYQIKIFWDFQCFGSVSGSASVMMDPNPDSDTDPR